MSTYLVSYAYNPDGRDLRIADVTVSMEALTEQEIGRMRTDLSNHHGGHSIAIIAITKLDTP